MKSQLSLVIIILLLGLSCSQNSDIGIGKYNPEITSTENLIAFVQLPENAENEFPWNREIYLLNSENGMLKRLTFDQFEDEDLAWSPTGDRIIFTSKRSLRPRARFNEGNNPSYLCIYDFSTKSERILNKNLTDGIISLGQNLKNEGYEINYNSDRRLRLSSPYWISANLLGCRIQLPFGIGRAYGDLCTFDTLGNNLDVITEIFEQPDWRIMWPVWINEDSILVNLMSKNNSNGKNAVAIYLKKEMQFVRLTSESSKVSSPSLARNSRQIIFLERKKADKLTSLIILDLKNNKRKSIDIDLEGVTGPELSPNGRKLAFFKSNEQVWGDDIYIMNINGTNIMRMTHNGGLKGSLRWSPNTSY